jgi:hypothetical protein
MLGRDADAEDAEFGHLAHDGVGDQLVGEVPAMRSRQHALVGEATELAADHVQRLVAQRLVDGRTVDQQGDQAARRSAVLP